MAEFTRAHVLSSRDVVKGSLDLQGMLWTVDESGGIRVTLMVDGFRGSHGYFEFRGIPVTTQTVDGVTLNVPVDAAHEAEWRGLCALYEAERLSPVTIDGTLFVIVGMLKGKR